TDLGDGRRWAVVSVADVSDRIRTERMVTELSRSYLTLAQLNQAVIRATDADGLFKDTCRIAVEQGGYLGAWVGVPSADGTVQAVAQAGALDVYIGQLNITTDPEDPHSHGPVGMSLRAGRTWISTDFLNDPATTVWHKTARKYGVAACASFPLRTAGRVVATLTLYADRPTAFDDGVGDLLAQVTDNVSFALEGFEGARALVAEEAARRGLLLRLVTAEEKERGRIAGDLHDDSVQVLAAVNLRLGLLKRRVGSSPELADVVAMVQTISDTVGVASESLRHLLFELEPPLLARSFVDALDTTAQYVFEGEPTTWALRCVGDVDVPDTERGQALRIVKEALINTRKHAHASHVDIDVRCVGGGLEVAVTDDGDGLPAGLDLEDMPQRPGHRGLETMRDRASATGGWCRLERSGTQGATLRFFIPTIGG
ncbi:MAG: GAF domain-containing protein, partial [Actinomycetota bacterium]|nr:GAF domain-containing protein [Actinomycetota bacterium]